jgi:hypothetical protein
MRSQIRLLLASTMIGTGCSDYELKNLCTQRGEGFDIEEVSVLQDVANYPNNRDGVILSFDDSGFASDESWRPVTIEVMVMLSIWDFDGYDDTSVVGIEVYDADNPLESEPYRLEQTLVRADLEWQDITLPYDAAIAGQLMDYEQKRAWMSFDFSDTIPDSGMESTEYLVSVTWDSSGYPAIGYSNFNLACDKNWTDYGDGAYVLNSTEAGRDECSWPMFRMELETQRYSDTCSESSGSI